MATSSIHSTLVLRARAPRTVSNARFRPEADAAMTLAAFALGVQHVRFSGGAVRCSAASVVLARAAAFIQPDRRLLLAQNQERWQRSRVVGLDP